MSEAQFSRQGEAPTAFERQLVAAIDPKLERDVWALIAQIIGAENVAVVLDHAAARAVNIPRREAFFQRLWKPRRDAEILRLVLAGKNDAVAAELCGCSEDAVFRVRHAHRRAIAGVTARMRAEFDAMPTYIGEVPCTACGGSVRSTASGQCVQCRRSIKREQVRRKATERGQSAAKGAG